MGNSSSSNAAAVKGSKSQYNDGGDDVQPLTETPAYQGNGANGNQEYPHYICVLTYFF